jgi:hypothetical protein
MAEFDGTDEYFDSRDVIARIAEIEEEYSETFMNVGGMPVDVRDEYVALIDLRNDAEVNVADWEFGETFVSDDYFVEYAKDPADDIGSFRIDYEWPLNHIDWFAAADELREDYTPFEFRGTTYWAR